MMVKDSGATGVMVSPTLKPPEVAVFRLRNARKVSFHGVSILDQCGLTSSSKGQHDGGR